MAWTREQLFADISKEQIEFIVNIAFVRNLLLGLLALSLSYPIVHNILNRYSTGYQELNHAVQNTLLQHAVEALFFTLIYPGFTYLLLSFSFEEPFDENGVITAGAVDRYGVLFVLCVLIGAMYMVEIVLRYRKMNPLVLFHHMCTISMFIICTIFPTAAVYKVSILLVYFASYEILTFYGLVMKVLFPLHSATPRMMVAGMILFGITRPVQLAWILVVLIGSWKEHVKWQAIFLIIASLTIGAIQCAALRIHYGMWKRCVLRQRKYNNEHESNTSCAEIGSEV